MSQKIFGNTIIMSCISQFLNTRDIISLSEANKKLYLSILNPEKNTIINTLYREQIIKKYFVDEDNIEILSNETNFNSNLLIDDYNETKNNWKKILKELEINLNNFSDKKVSNIIYELFKNHLYLSDIRKDNKFLEYENSDFHQNHCYDWFQRISFLVNYYKKYFDNKQKPEKIIGRHLIYEEKLINYIDIENEIENSNEEQILINQIFEYDFEKIEKYYSNNRNNKKINDVLLFILWLIKTSELFSKMLSSYMTIFDKSIEEKEIINEYINKQKAFLQFAKSINENFNNINIILNNLYYHQNKTNNKTNFFSLYEMIKKIMEKNFTSIIKSKIMKNFNKFLKKYFQNLFAEKNWEINSEGSTQSNSFEYDEEMEIEEEIKYFKEDDKYLLEEFVNCILNLNINPLNANLINHTGIKLGDEYNNIENLLIKSFIEELKKNIEFLSIEEINKIINYFIYDEFTSFRFIRRTKIKLLRETTNSLTNHIIKKLTKEFNEYLNGATQMKKTAKIYLEETYLNFLSSKQKKWANEFYENQLETIKNYLKINFPQKNTQINEYFMNTNLEILSQVKNLIEICSFLIGIFKERNNIVMNIINTRIQEKEFIRKNVDL